eukprot:TRINITY_DN6130_c0_g1_i5.p1 TRINITY_DN6130_c0_g1~~TRINITY_DN6130_c0_g1_i5.p1  ORF type:complete len:230 (-),score=59.54 TRINITY_DN6130_c0_g1_i5:72-761(-)
MMCFSNLLLGTTDARIGGIGVFNSNPLDIEAYRELLLKKYSNAKCGKQRDTVVIDQQEDRPIYNLDLLVEHVTKAFPKFNVKVVSLASMKLPERIALLCRAHIFIAVHGPALYNIALMPREGTVLEIFPYGFHAPTFQTLAKRLEVSYYGWQNINKDRTRFHPEVLDRWDLEDAERDLIINAPKYDPQLPSPAVSYWTEQETGVVLKQIMDAVRKAGPQPMSGPKKAEL